MRTKISKGNIRNKVGRRKRNEKNFEIFQV